MSQVQSSLDTDISPFFNGSTDSTGDLFGGGGSTTDGTAGVPVDLTSGIIGTNDNTPDANAALLDNSAIPVSLPQVINDNSAGATNDAGKQVSQPSSTNTNFLQGILNAVGAGAQTAVQAGVATGNAYLQTKEQQQLVQQQTQLQQAQNKLTAAQLQNPLYYTTTPSTGNEKTVILIIGIAIVLVLGLALEK